MKPDVGPGVLVALSCAATVATGCGIHVSVLEASGPSSCASAPNPVDTSHPAALVGDGSPGSCSEEALNLALETGGVIRFRCGASPLVIPVTAEKVIARDTVLDGGNTITLDGGGGSRIFVVGAPGGPAVSLTLQYLTLRGGYATVTPASAGGSARTGGGAVLQFGGTLVITDSVLRDNEASAAGADVAGGAVCSLGGRVVIARTVLDGNRAGSGGALAALASDLTLARAQLTNNQATGRGGITAGIGGALLADEQGQSVTMCQVTLSGNRAETFGTAMHLQGIAGEAVTIEQTSILDNRSRETDGADGGPAVFLGILTTRLSQVTVARNQGQLTPGVWVNGGTQAAQAATIHFSNVTIADNSVYLHADVTRDGVGAALWIEGIVRGELVNCTLAGNVSEFGSGIVHAQQLVVRNTIIANRGTNVWNPQNCSDLAETASPASGDHVLQWPPESLDSYLCVAGATIAEPQLGALQDNGGSVLTMLPAPTSPAVGVGVDCPATDARGRARQAPCTLGAVEVDGTSGACPSCSQADASVTGAP